MFKKLILTLTLLNLSFVYAARHNHMSSKSTLADTFAWATNINSIQDSIWPFQLRSIGHSMQSFQNYSSSAYWHDGLDIRGDENQKVFSTVDGKVVNIENYRRGNNLYWEVAILDDSGFVWKYHHVDKNSIPRKIKLAYKNGERIIKGEYIGNIVSWPVTSYGEVYHHIHLLVVDGEGRYVNPFLLLPKLKDTKPPVISKIGLFNSQRKMINGDKISGKHGLYIEASDLVLHNEFKLTPYLIIYSLDNGPFKTVWKFDHLPSMTNDVDYINDFYLKKTCGNYRCRKFLINLNFDTTKAKATAFFNLKQGKHQVQVEVKDFVGNSTQKEFIYFVE